MSDIIRKAVELGIDGVDITGWFKSADASYTASLRHLASKWGMFFWRGYGG